MTRYLALALLLSAFSAHAQTRSWTYDAVGNVLTSTDANGHTTSYTYDGLNRRTAQTDPAPIATTQQWSYDAAGNVLTHTDRRGIVTATTYDKENRPVEVKRDGLRIATSTYDAAGNLSRSTDANGEATTYAYDAANRKRGEQRPLNHARQWTYTPWDAIATATDADGYVTAYAYDVRQRLIEQTDPAGETTTHGYDGVGNRTRTTRPGGLEWTYAFDEADRLIRITSPEGATTAYRHDAHGNRTRFTDAQGQITTTAYDSRHRPTRINHPGGSHEEFTYDQEANPTGHTDASGRTIASTYDALNRRIRRSYGSVPSGDVQEERWDYDGNGNPTRIQQHTGSATHTTERAWDRHERLVQETDRHSQTIQWGYDAHGNRITRTDAEGTTSTPPDRLNRTTRLTAPDGNATLFAYTAEGRLTTLTQPNGAQTEHGYDAAGRIETIAHRQSGTLVSTTAYSYDARGNRTGETHTDNAGTRVLTYGYDDDDRLTSTQETAPDGSTTQTTYTLDATGNRTREQVTQNGVTTKDVSYTYGPRQQLDQSVDAIGGITATYTYDANGALKEETRNGQTTHYRQNAQDRLATLTLPGAPPIQYTYDAEGRRVEKLSSSEGRRYVWDGQQIRRETNVTGNPLTSYEWSSGRILRSKQGSAIAYAQHDALKSPTRWSRQDGGEQGKTRYGAWGTTDSQQGTTPPIGYTGHYQDPETGDYYAQQRYYRPGIGRFTRTDPAEPDYLNPITANPYLYANGNPLLFVDPTGLYGIFFDGTWNDGPNTIGSSQHTNVFRLSRLYDETIGGVPDYQLGVGTSRLSQVPGGATGLGARSRIDDAYNNLVRWYNSPEAREMRANDPERWEQARQIDVFGFSRGAAQAREFVNVLKERGIPVTKTVVDARGREHHVPTGEMFQDVDVRFLGIFDTVAAMGIPTNGVNISYDMRVDPSAVRNVRHAVAADEFRRSFDLVSIGTDYDTMPAAHLKERYFRGAHSSVGGGYGPGSQGKPNSLARTTLHWIHAEARAAGVPLLDIVGEDSALPYLDQLDEDDIRTGLVHDSRRGWTGTLERMENRQRRTIYYPSSGKKETVSRGELIKRWRASEQGSAFVVKESEDELILEPLEENW